MKRALVDVSNVIWQGFMEGKDVEFGRSYPNPKEGLKSVWVNGADHVVHNANSFLMQVLDQLGIQPCDVILVVEGQNSKILRQQINPDYKTGKDKLDPQYEQFNKAKDKLLDTWLKLGAQVAIQKNCEADDTMAYLALKLKGEKWIISGDKDMAVLVGGDIHHYRNGVIDKNPFGDFDHKYIPVYIALVGDTADNIKGAWKFGDGAFLKMRTVFGDGCLPMMKKLIEEKRLLDLQEDVGELKELQRIIDSAQSVYDSYACALLYPQRVNTLRLPMEWKVGMVRGREFIEDERLHKWAGAVRLVHAGNYTEAMKWAKPHIEASPYVSLDIETSTPWESDEWIERLNKDEGKVVDTFGSTLTGLGMTFGVNRQYTLYLTVDHVCNNNITVAQARDFVDLVPRNIPTVVHNFAFEGPVLYQAWGKDWADDELYRGFLRNVRDTKIASSYVDENRRAGLKNLSSEVLGYEQETYEHVTTATIPAAEWDGRGRVLDRFVTGADDGEGVEYVKVQRKMNQLTPQHVLSYGADDCICTAALYNHFVTVMEIEDTFRIFEEVETFPAYLTNLAFAHGTPIDLNRMNQLEREDDKVFEEQSAILREYLMKIGFDGTRCPVYEEINPAAVKEAYLFITGTELESRNRRLDKLAVDVEEECPRLANILRVAQEDAATALPMFNDIVAEHFNGEPKLDLASPKQMKALLYDHIGIPVKIINDVTPLEKQHKRDLADAAMKFKQWRAGKDVTMRPEELQLLKAKAKTDDTAIAFALTFDSEYINDEAKAALVAIGKVKEVMTRRSLFYNNYRNIEHWKDGNVHSSINQCSTVTRRYSSSGPNLQQLPKKGAGVKFRSIFVPHTNDAVVCSIDFGSQELRLAAWKSQDKGMLSCYIGDVLRDIHSLTASGAMKLKWGAGEVGELFQKYGPDLTEGENGEYELFIRLRELGKQNFLGKLADDLRKDSKGVNFTVQFGGRASKVSETLVMPLEDAKLFIDARNARFPDVDKAAEKAADKCKQLGYAETFLGARRHLQKGIKSADRGEVERAARQAWSMEIQGSAAEMTKLAMARLWLSGALFKYDVRFIAPIHDELVTSVKREHALDFIKIKHECMVQKYADMEVPVIGSISIGPNFGEQYECGDEYILENIQKYLDVIFHEKKAA